MANNLTASNKEKWDKELQIELEKNLTGLDICKIHGNLDGYDIIDKPYMSKHLGQSYTKGTNFTVQDITSTNEQLSLDQVKCVPLLIDKVDMVQNFYSARQNLSPTIAEDLRRGMDAKILDQYDQAASDIDDGDIGGTSGVSAVVTPSNVAKLFSSAGKKLNNLSVGLSDRFAIISPTILEYMQLYIGGKDTMFGDQVLQRGRVGSAFGFDVYLSQNLTFTSRWTPANNPTAADTVTINGVVFTFQATLGVVPGALHIGTATANTLTNMVAALNAPGTAIADATETGYIAITLANQVLLEGIVATDGTTYLGIEHVGGGEVAVAASETADLWSLETVHCLFGKRGAIDFGMQRSPEIGFNQEPKLLPGSGNLVAWDMFGVKTFLRNKDMLVDVNCDSSSW